IFGLLLGVQVIKVAEELIESMRGRQKLVTIAKVILSELPSSVAKRSKQISNGWIFRLQSEIGSGKSHFCKAGADWRLAGYECGAPGSAALLPIPVGEQCPFFCNTINIGRAIPHDSVVISADVKPPDVISPDDQDVRLFRHLSYFVRHWLVSYSGW